MSGMQENKDKKEREKEQKRAGSPSDQEGGLGLFGRVGNVPFLMVIYVYRVTLSPFLGGQCRYEPTCSWYGIEAYKRYGPIRGTWMTAGRILRCHPFAKGGYDPVPIRDDVGCGSYDEDARGVEGLPQDSLTEHEGSEHRS